MTVTSRLHGRDVDDDVYYDIRWSLSEEERRWVLLKIPRGDTEGVGEGK